MDKIDDNKKSSKKVLKISIIVVLIILLILGALALAGYLYVKNMVGKINYVDIRDS